jgi:SOS-response transcriptional repressor LexA
MGSETRVPQKALGENIKRLREQKGLSQFDLASKAEIDQGNLSKLERGQMPYIPESLYRMAQVLGVPLSLLLSQSDELEMVDITSKRVPVLDHVQAGAWTEVNGQPSESDVHEYVLSNSELSSSSFAMYIRGDSMRPEFGEGDLIIVDHEIEPRPGDYVVAVNGSGEATFKRYRVKGVNESGQNVFELVPSNPDFPTMRSDVTQIRIIGTMVEHRKFRKKFPPSPYAY